MVVDINLYELHVEPLLWHNVLSLTWAVLIFFFCISFFLLSLVSVLDVIYLLTFSIDSRGVEGNPENEMKRARHLHSKIHDFPGTILEEKEEESRDLQERPPEVMIISRLF